eukprot:3473446-Pyramimonas_sp.AAC.1
MLSRWHGNRSGPSAARDLISSLTCRVSRVHVLAQPARGRRAHACFYMRLQGEVATLACKLMWARGGGRFGSQV